jgi:hypothetical protein
MQTWRYAWTLAPLLAVVALGTNIALQGSRWVGCGLIVVGILGFALVFLKEIVERPERAHALYDVGEGKQATYLYSYTEFRRLPEQVRSRLLQDRDVRRWFRVEMHRHGGERFNVVQTRLGKVRYRCWLWVLSLLT